MTILETPTPPWQQVATGAWLKAHPDVSAGLSFVLTAALAGSTVRFALAQDYLWMTAAYLAALAAGIFGALETKRAGQGGVR